MCLVWSQTYVTCCELKYCLHATSAYQVCINVEVVLLEQLLPALSPCGSQLYIADCDFTPLLNVLQR